MPFEEPDLKTLLRTLENFRPGAPLDKFIGEVVFPNFKNISPGTKIEFGFPITALVGANGTGKSSILHALWGMPLRYSTSRFWFSTAIDPIEDGGALGVPRYFYKHWISALRRYVETRKVRGRRRTDYWEPARALESDGMAPMPPMDEPSRPYRSAERWNPTERPVKYINFKCEFSAFDRYFYYPYLTENRQERQERFQNGAKRLKTVITRQLTSYSPGGRKAVFENRALTGDELSWVSYILGREYVRARYVLHELYGRVESPSVFFERADASYSEAFAGSGELAVVRAVMEISAATNFTLVLLDEPETSLHPGAQVRLLAYLANMVRNKKLQIVMSTHSPTIVEQLPSSAIKVLEDGPNGRSRIVSVTHPQVAFNRLGYSGQKILVAVEDDLLRSLVEIAMEGLDEGERDAIQLYIPPGGADAILTYSIPNWIDENRDAFIILDGDKVPHGAIPDPEALTAREFEEVGTLIHGLFGVRPMHISGSNRERAAAYLQWAKERFYYLDVICPEYVILEALDPTLVNADMTNQQAKAAFIDELERQHKATDARALAVAAQWVVPTTNVHIVHLRECLHAILQFGNRRR
jgi:predicted ATPase